MANETANEPLLVSEREAARLLGMCTKSLYRLRRAGRIEYVKIGLGDQRIRYTVQSLRNFIAANLHRTAPQ
jgi:Helix-turn-helix domain